MDNRVLGEQRPVLMHAAYVGHHDSVFLDVAQWRCSRCGHETDWLPRPTTNERPPCPRCNREGLAE